MLSNYSHNNIPFFLALVFLLISCDAAKDWSEEKDSIAPGVVSDVRVENLNGGARIYYKLPADPDLMGAKAVYSLTKDGPLTEKYSTTDTLELDGFGDTELRTVTLFALDNSGNMSDGVETTIKPLIPAIENMRQSLRTESAFGGLRVKWDNELRKDMSISLYVLDSITGNMTLTEKFFSNDKNGMYTFRPFESKPQQFRIEMQDRWGNFATPLDTVVTPLFEEQILGKINNKFVFSQYGDDDDTWRDRGDSHNYIGNETAPRVFSMMYDGVWAPTSGWDVWHANQYLTLGDYVPGRTDPLHAPHYFTFDMGGKSVYSRINMTVRQHATYYGTYFPCIFEIWGTNDPKPLSNDRMENLAYWTNWEEVNGTDAWKNDWVKLSHCQIYTSNGDTFYYVNMPLSDYDKDRAHNSGFDFDMSEGVMEPFRYLRFVVLGVTTQNYVFAIREIRFWGSYAD